MPLLQLKDIHCYYGNIHAIKGVSQRNSAAQKG